MGVRMTAWPGFASLLVPMSVDDFLEEYWGRRTLLVSREQPAIRSLFSWERLYGYLAEQELPTKVAHRDEQGCQVERGTRSEFARSELQPGRTLCVQDLHRVDSELGHVLGEARRTLGMAANHVVSCYASAEAGGFGLHYDDQHVFILQVEGTKHWRFGRTPVVSHPPNNLLLQDRERQQRLRSELDIPLPQPEEFDEAVLTPGQVLYLPPGTWHSGRAADRSLGLTMSFAPTRFLPTIESWLRRTLERDVTYRAGAPPLLQLEATAGPPEKLRQHFECQKRHLLRTLEGLTLEQYWDCWCQGFGRRFSNATADLAPLLVVPGEDRVVVQRGPKRLTLPQESRELVVLVIHALNEGKDPEGVALVARFHEADVVALLRLLQRSGLWDG